MDEVLLMLQYDHTLLSFLLITDHGKNSSLLRCHRPSMLISIGYPCIVKLYLTIQSLHCILQCLVQRMGNSTR